MGDKPLTTPPFPGVYKDPLVRSPKLQAALDRSIAAGPGSKWRVPVVIVSLEPDGTRPMAHFKGDEVHFSASLLKVAAMYSAFALREALRGIAAELGGSTNRSAFLKTAAAYLDPKILARAGTIPALTGVSKANALPLYAEAFEITQLASRPGVAVSLSAAFVEHLEKMIAISDNRSASECVHNSGYGFLNGLLAATGFFDPKLNKGIWLAGDYVSKYPYFRIQSVNDGLVAQAASSIALARLYTLIYDGGLVNPGSSQEMCALLAKAVAASEVFIDRATALDFTVTHTKVGLGPLKAANGGQSVYSEASILLHRTGRRFVAVWQNFVFGAGGFDPIGHVVRNTINDFLR